MKKRSFYSNLIFSLGLNLLVKPTAIFVIDAAVQNEVGSDYGVYFAFFNLSLIISIIFDLGINNYSTRLSAQNLDQSKKYFSTILGLRLFLMGFYLIGIIGLKFFSTLSWVEYKLILILGFNQFLIANISFFRSYFAGLQRFRIDAFFSILDRLLLIFSMGYILYIHPNGSKLIDIERYALIQFGCYLLSFLIAILTTLIVVKPKIERPQLNLILPLLKKAFPYALLIILMTLYTRIDAWFILNFSHGQRAAEASYYAQAYRIIDALYMFAMIFAGLLFPMFSKLIKENPGSIQNLVAQSSKLLLGASFAFVIFCFFRGGLVMDQIYRNTTEESHLLIFLLSLAFVGMATNLIYGSLLTANGSLKALNTISFLGLVLNILLNFWLIPRALNHAEIVAASVAVLTQLFVALAQSIYCKKLFNFPLLHNGLWRYVLLIFFTSTWYLMLLRIPKSFIPQAPIIILLFDIVINILLLFILRFIDFKELSKILQLRSKTQ